MIDDRQQELAALYALDLLEGAEATAFTAELRRSAELETLVRELRESSAAYSLTAPQVSPSSELKMRIISRLSDKPAAAVPAAEPAQVLFFRPAVIIPWAIAAGLAMGCFWLVSSFVRTRADHAVLQQQLTLAEVESSSARNQLEAERILSNRQLADATTQVGQLNQQVAQSTEKISEATRVLGETVQQLDRSKSELTTRHTELAQINEKLAAATTLVGELETRLRSEGDLAQFKIATLASMAGNSPQALAVAVWNPKTQQGILRVEKLPALASDKDYQLWLIDPAYPAPVDGGVFTVDPATGHAQVNFKPNQKVNNAAKFAVSLERKGGVPKAEGPILLLGD
ncbi:MAG: anti-sigma factor [Opitutus sp.]